MNCTWEKKDGRWVCQAKECTHHLPDGGCKLGKVSLTCDDTNCKWNKASTQAGIYVCISMDIHLDADGHCLGKQDV